jgi:hypothetical protein
LQTFMDNAERLSVKIDVKCCKSLWRKLLQAELAILKELYLVGEMGVGLQ